ncbi:MAG: hypothetical protein AAB638_01255 [Patescibacteria group bacterium]
MSLCILLIQPDWTDRARFIERLREQGFGVHSAENIGAGKTVWVNYPLDAIVITHSMFDDEAESLSRELLDKIPVFICGTTHRPDAAEHIVRLVEGVTK